MNSDMQKGRDYLMSLNADEITVEDALDAFGFGRNGLKTRYDLSEETPKTWETVEQWEKRTGMVYPDDGPVYYTHKPYNGKPHPWVLVSLKKAKERYNYFKYGPEEHLRNDLPIIIIANHLGEPTEEYRPK